MRIRRISSKPDQQQTGKPDMEALKRAVKDYKNKESGLIPLLQFTQNHYGFIPEAAFGIISEATAVPVADIYGVSTFYAQFRLKPAGKNVLKVCHGTACHVQGANAISDALHDTLKINNGDTTADGLFTLEQVACLGCCSLAPVMMIGENTYGNLSPKSTVKIIKDIKNQAVNEPLNSKP